MRLGDGVLPAFAARRIGLVREYLKELCDHGACARGASALCAVLLRGQARSVHTVKAGVQKAVRLGREAMLRTQHILEHLVYCACHDQQHGVGGSSTEREWGSALFGKPISESSLPWRPGSIMSSSPIFACRRGGVTAGYAWEEQPADRVRAGRPRGGARNFSREAGGIYSGPAGRT